MTLSVEGITYVCGTCGADLDGLGIAHSCAAEIQRLRTGWDADVEWANKLLLERDRYRAVLEEIETTLQEGSTVPLPRLRAWNLARRALREEAGS